MTDTISTEDRAILRELATRYAALADSERNRSAVECWRDLNNMRSRRPLVYCNTHLLGPDVDPHLPEQRVKSELLRPVERWFQRALWLSTLQDDHYFDPWFTVRATMATQPDGLWGIRPNRVEDEGSRGWHNLPVLKTRDDLAELKATEHRVLGTNPLVKPFEDVIGDILPIHVKRNTVYPVWGGTDLSEAPGALFGLEELLMALYTDPDMIHAFMTFTRDAVLANLKQGEAAGDWSTVDSFYYLTPTYCDELPDPAPNSHGAKLKELAWFFHAQEFEGVSPAMFEEFLFNYQLPIMELFGRVTYGCCETLDQKFNVLKRLPNLTKIVSGPRSDPACYPKAFGDRCVISWRPVSAIVAAERFDEDAQRRQLREGLAKLEGCNVEVHMHEPMTVRGELGRVKRWIQIAREETV